MATFIVAMVDTLNIMESIFLNSSYTYYSDLAEIGSETGMVKANIVSNLNIFSCSFKKV